MPTSIVNQGNCGNNTNVGVSDCQINLSFITRVIGIPKGFVIPATATVDSTTFNAYINDALVSASRSGTTPRFYITQPLLEINDKTGDVVTETRNNTEYIVTSKPYNWGWLVSELICDYKNMRNLFQFSQSRLDYLFVDSLGNVWGNAAVDADGANGVGGFTMAQTYIPDWTPATSQKLVKFMLTMIFANNLQLTDTSVFIASNYVPSSSGLIDVKLAKGTVGTTSATALYVTGTYGCGGSNLGNYDQLADPDAWTVATSTGTAVVPTAVTYNSTTKEFQLTIPSTPATALTVGLPDPSILTVAPFFANLITETPNKVTITTP